jgi:hypothetical protein
MRSSAALTLRMLAGLAAAPVAAVLSSVGVYDAFWHAGLMQHGVPLHSIDAAAPLAAGVFTLGVVVTGVAAVPGVIWLNERRSLTLARLLMFGAVIGNLPFALIVAGVIVARLVGGLTGDISQNWYGLSGALANIAMGVVAGAGGAATFWLVSVCGTTADDRRSTVPVNAP